MIMYKPCFSFGKRSLLGFTAKDEAELFVLGFPVNEAAELFLPPSLWFLTELR